MIAKKVGKSHFYGEHINKFCSFTTRFSISLSFFFLSPYITLYSFNIMDIITEIPVNIQDYREYY